MRLKMCGDMQFVFKAHVGGLIVESLWRGGTCRGHWHVADSCCSHACKYAALLHIRVSVRPSARLSAHIVSDWSQPSCPLTRNACKLRRNIIHDNIGLISRPAENGTKENAQRDQSRKGVLWRQPLKSGVVDIWTSCENFTKIGARFYVTRVTLWQQNC